MANLQRNDLVYPELSYRIVGVLYDVYNRLGGNHREIYYQRAIAQALRLHNIAFERELVMPLTYRNDSIGRYFLDFLIDNKIVLEIKRGNYFPRDNIEQIYSYLRQCNLKLGILANFTSSGVRCKRILNLRSKHSYIRTYS